MGDNEFEGGHFDLTDVLLDLACLDKMAEQLDSTREDEVVAGLDVNLVRILQKLSRRLVVERKRLLDEYTQSGQLRRMKTKVSLAELLHEAAPDKYFAIMAYLRQTAEMDSVMQAVRKKIIERYHIATTLGYGPRFLHSTGQLHKGGQNTGLFLQIVANHTHDLPIPGEPYTFGVVADAQALGDLEALQSAGRRVTRVQLAHADAMSLKGLVDRITGETRKFAGT